MDRSINSIQHGMFYTEQLLLIGNAGQAGREAQHEVPRSIPPPHQTPIDKRVKVQDFSLLGIATQKNLSKPTHTQVTKSPPIIQSLIQNTAQSSPARCHILRRTSTSGTISSGTMSTRYPIGNWRILSQRGSASRLSRLAWREARDK